MAEIFQDTNDDWKTKYKTIKTFHDEAYSKIDQGISCEHNNQIDAALQKYDEGLLLIDKALGVPIDCPTNPDPTWERACKMAEQMKRTRKEILSRLADIQTARHVAAQSLPRRDEPDAPPSYDEAIASCSSTSSGPSIATTPTTSSSSQCPSYVASGSRQSTSSITDGSQIKNEKPKSPSCSTSPSQSTHTPSTSQPRTISLSELGKALESVRHEIANQSSVEIFTCNNVCVCHVSQDGQIGTSSQTEVLKIFLTEGLTIWNHPDNDENNPRYYIQVGAWRYPLIKGVSPCIRTPRHGAFLFPDVESGVEGKAIALIVPDDCVEPLAAILEDILNVEIQYGAHPGTRPPSDLPETISQHIISGGNYISNALIKGAEKVEQCLSYGTPRVIEKISPNREPTEMPSKLQKTVKVTKNVSESAAKTTGYIANKVSSATVGLGKFLSPHVYKGGTSLLTKYYGYQEQEANQTVDNVLTVGAGAMEGIGAVYSGLEVAGAVLGRSISDSTVQIVKHKYGQPAGEFTQDTFHTVGNVLEVNTNVRSLATKRLIKNTVKQTGKQVVLEYGAEKDKAGSKSPKKLSSSESKALEKSSSSEKSPKKGSSPKSGDSEKRPK
uniref:Protein spartin n=1 Tax=Cacopsylla melanoneura TaxID=428564 RepID=A0A8D8Q4M9_9HEMI